MAKPVRILAFAGSTRTHSYNKKLVQIAAQGATDAKALVTLIDLREYPLPIFDADLEEEQGMPENAEKLKKLFLEHQGLLISSPEYNSSISGVLKNTLDWISREAEGEAPFAPFKDKAVALLSASPGQLGGLRGLVTVRSILGNMKCIVLPDQLAIGGAGDAFAEDGSLKDPKRQAAALSMGKKLAQFLERLSRD